VTGLLNQLMNLFRYACQAYRYGATLTLPSCNVWLYRAWRQAPWCRGCCARFPGQELLWIETYRKSDNEDDLVVSIIGVYHERRTGSVKRGGEILSSTADRLIVRTDALPSSSSANNGDLNWDRLSHLKLGV
jgi:hypothetical protein